MRKILSLLGCMMLVLSAAACKPSDDNSKEMGSTTTVAPMASPVVPTTEPAPAMAPAASDATTGSAIPLPPEAIISPNANAPTAAPGSGTPASDNTMMQQSPEPVTPSPAPAAPTGTQQ